MWDFRRKDPVMHEEGFDDFVSDISADPKRKYLFAVSGDGTMNTYSLRQRKLYVKSKKEKQDLLCVEVIQVKNLKHTNWLKLGIQIFSTAFKINVF